jgi:hypothetical protein
MRRIKGDPRKFSVTGIIAPPDATGCGSCIDFIDVYLNTFQNQGPRFW